MWFLDPSEGAISLDQQIDLWFDISRHAAIEDQSICVPTFTSDHELRVVTEREVTDTNS